MLCGLKPTTHCQLQLYQSREHSTSTNNTKPWFRSQQTPLLPIATLRIVLACSSRLPSESTTRLSSPNSSPLLPHSSGTPTSPPWESSPRYGRQSSIELSTAGSSTSNPPGLSSRPLNVLCSLADIQPNILLDIASATLQTLQCPWTIHNFPSSAISLGDYSVMPSRDTMYTATDHSRGIWPQKKNNPTTPFFGITRAMRGPCSHAASVSKIIETGKPVLLPICRLPSSLPR